MKAKGNQLSCFDILKKNTDNCCGYKNEIVTNLAEEYEGKYSALRLIDEAWDADECAEFIGVCTSADDLKVFIDAVDYTGQTDAIFQFGDIEEHTDIARLPRSLVELIEKVDEFDDALLFETAEEYGFCKYQGISSFFLMNLRMF